MAKRALHQTLPPAAARSPTDTCSVPPTFQWVRRVIPGTRFAPFWVRTLPDLPYTFTSSPTFYSARVVAFLTRSAFVYPLSDFIPSFRSLCFHVSLPYITTDKVKHTDHQTYLAFLSFMCPFAETRLLEFPLRTIGGLYNTKERPI